VHLNKKHIWGKKTRLAIKKILKGRGEKLKIAGVPRKKRFSHKQGESASGNHKKSKNAVGFLFHKHNRQRDQRVIRVKVKRGRGGVVFSVLGSFFLEGSLARKRKGGGEPGRTSRGKGKKGGKRISKLQKTKQKGDQNKGKVKILSGESLSRGGGERL